MDKNIYRLGGRMEGLIDKCILPEPIEHLPTILRQSLIFFIFPVKLDWPNGWSSMPTLLPCQVSSFKIGCL